MRRIRELLGGRICSGIQDEKRNIEPRSCFEHHPAELPSAEHADGLVRHGCEMVSMKFTKS